MQALVYTLLDVFDASRDLYNTLRNKERRDYEDSLRSKGYSRRVEYVEDDFGSDEGIVMDKAAVTRQFDLGRDEVGSTFAVGDGEPLLLVYEAARSDVEQSSRRLDSSPRSSHYSHSS